MAAGVVQKAASTNETPEPDWTGGGKQTLLRTLAVLGIAVPRAL